MTKIVNMETKMIEEMDSTIAFDGVISGIYFAYFHKGAYAEHIPFIIPERARTKASGAMGKDFIY